MPRGKKSVANYAPEMLELFKAGAKQPITIDFMTPANASTFAYRMNRLRMAMRDEEHWLLPAAEACAIALDKEAKTVTVKPVDMTFVPKIREALAKLPQSAEPEEETHLSGSHEIEPQTSVLDKFLKGE